MIVLNAQLQLIHTLPEWFNKLVLLPNNLRHVLLRNEKQANGSI